MLCYVISGMLESYGSRLAPIWLGAVLSYPVWLDYDIHVYGLPKSSYEIGCYVLCPVRLDYDKWLTKEPLYGWLLRCNIRCSWIMFGGLPMMLYPVWWCYDICLLICQHMA